MTTREEIYSFNIFLNAVLPLVKVVVYERENLRKKFESFQGVIQISANRRPDEGGKIGTHYCIENGEWQVKKGLHDNPKLELEFKSVEHLNGFFKGTSKKLPKIKGFYRIGLLMSTLKALMTMAKLLGNTEVPKDQEDAKLMTKMYFYLLSSGISQLNKSCHPQVKKWVERSPDRVYAWRVKGESDISAYVRVKAGKSKASRGVYKRAKPFFTMYFDSVESALGILLEKDNLLESTASGKLSMLGAPEYGAQIGEYMMLVGSYVK